MAKYNKKEVKRIFELNPGVDKIYITDNGIYFLPSAEGYLKAYVNRKKIGYFVVTRSEVFLDNDKKEGRDNENKNKAESKENIKKVGQPKK